MTSQAHAAECQTNRTSELDFALPAMDALSEELNRLAAINAELIGRIRGAAAQSQAHAPRDAGAEVDGLRQENAELRARVEVLEQMVLTANDEDSWAERQREYEALLEEKSEVIRSLHMKIQELQQEDKPRPSNEPLPREEELVQLRRELEEQKRQLEEDEETLMTQMRQMELALSKDRAELARQRQDMQRLQAELNREVEQAGRDDGLRERLANLRRPRDESKKDKKDATPAPEQKSSGLLKRLFG